ncbi:Golgi transport complex subunit 1 [Dermatophagoides pteronyssinus]|uniref:Golgi transport complex subunit 1 n=2 Tax=Dermatophagoides pteronyssinus TaxID=6956 RepID=A0ABQ8J8D2_DERPT|nr:conserved oligomeric Golgi complex subunit 1-like [Dermatophagoides pteronyssinus]KAH9418803.1 Golgi transport complex subunit 1 [Dermatophagoides pteronyssinus]
MESTNVDYLFRNYLVSDVVLVQQKLKNDVQKKQNDLKQLIGERYNELFRATDSFGHMNLSINQLIDSLKKLSTTVQESKDGHKPINVDQINDSNFPINDNYFANATVCKFLLDLPLQIWNFLHEENFFLATYGSYFGDHIVQYLADQQQSFQCSNICSLRLYSIHNLKSHIIRNCWQQIAEQSLKNDINLDEFARKFSYLKLLKNCSTTEVIDDFFKNQANNIDTIINETNQISILIEQILNIIFNTIKCSRIFHQSENDSLDCLLQIHLKEICSTNHVDELIDASHAQRIRWPKKLLFYTINDSIKIESDKKIKFDETILVQWIQTIKTNFSTKIEQKFKSVESIRELFQEITIVEQWLMKNSILENYCTFVNVIDFNKSIWTEWFMALFETRVYEITSIELQSIQTIFIESLPMIEQNLFNCDLNIVEFVWKESNQPSRINDFNGLVQKTCDMINQKLSNFYEDIIIFQHSHQTFLIRIHSSIAEFLRSLQIQIDSVNKNRQKSLLLFGAVLFQRMPDLCPSISQIFSMCDRKTDCLSWQQISTQLREINESYLQNLFDITITEHFAHIDPKSFVDLNQFLKNFSIWETITISNDQDDQSKTIVEVPMQLSLKTYKVLHDISNDINRFCAHTVTRQVLINILRLIGRQIVILYGDALKILSELTDPVLKPPKQIISIQLYFDLFFLKKLFIQIKHDDHFRCEYLEPINTMMTELESNIDPFDMHLIHPYIEANVYRLQKSYQITFGFLLFERLMNSNLSKPMNNSNNENVHNLMLIHSCHGEDFKTMLSK